MNRRRFLSIIWMALPLLGWLPGCGRESTDLDTESDSSGTSGTSGSGRCTRVAHAVQGNHGHVVQISSADVASGGTRSYSIRGSAGHSHNVTLQAADFAALAAGETIQVQSTQSGGHSHAIRFRCSS